jgi:hypothetical protein
MYSINKLKWTEERRGEERRRQYTLLNTYIDLAITYNISSSLTQQFPESPVERK